MMKIRLDNKGFSLVELLIAVVISLVILGAVSVSFTTALRVFKDAKSISDNIETKTPAVELISRYFDRWGVGVVSQADKGPSCTSCPAQRKSLIITTSGGCSDVTFWGNIHGYGFVQNISVDGTTASLVSCRLNRADNQNCYIIWSSNTPMNPVVGGNVDPVSLPADLNPVNADCSNLTSANPTNATMGTTLYTRTALSPRPLQIGDLIHRSPHQIRLYCAQNSQDANRLWLYVGLADRSNGFCNDGQDGPYPLAPVNAFTAVAIPEDPLPPGTTCDPATGGTGCAAVQVSITFRSPSQRYAGQFDTYTVTKVFGR